MNMLMFIGVLFLILIVRIVKYLIGLRVYTHIVWAKVVGYRRSMRYNPLSNHRSIRSVYSPVIAYEHEGVIYQKSSNSFSKGRAVEEGGFIPIRIIPENPDKWVYHNKGFSNILFSIAFLTIAGIPSFRNELASVYPEIMQYSFWFSLEFVLLVIGGILLIKAIIDYMRMDDVCTYKIWAKVLTTNDGSPYLKYTVNDEEYKFMPYFKISEYVVESSGFVPILINPRNPEEYIKYTKSAVKVDFVTPILLLVFGGLVCYIMIPFYQLVG